MKYYEALLTTEYFTAGKCYLVLDYIQGGILTADNDNHEHYLSYEYLLQYFKEADNE